MAEVKIQGYASRTIFNIFRWIKFLDQIPKRYAMRTLLG